MTLSLSPVEDGEEVVEAPLSAEADLAQDPVVFHVHVLLQLHQRILRRRNCGKALPSNTHVSLILEIK